MGACSALRFSIEQRYELLVREIDEFVKEEDVLESEKVWCERESASKGEAKRASLYASFGYVPQ